MLAQWTVASVAQISGPHICRFVKWSVQKTQLRLFTMISEVGQCLILFLGYQNADLTNANLEGANLEGANLKVSKLVLLIRLELDHLYSVCANDLDETREVICGS